jgi:hypothetical protein
MRLPTDAQLLRIFIGQDDKFQGKALYEAIVLKAREAGLAGATVYKGMLGFGANSRVHTSKILRLSQSMPVVVEIVDTPENIQDFLPTLDDMITEGLVTLEKAHVIAYRHA